MRQAEGKQTPQIAPVGRLNRSLANGVRSFRQLLFCICSSTVSIAAEKRAFLRKRRKTSEATFAAPSPSSARQFSRSEARTVVESKRTRTDNPIAVAAGETCDPAVHDLCRRLSLDDADDDKDRSELASLADGQLPVGSSASQILTKQMIAQLAEVLPPRAQAYSWISVYDSEHHGFSLATLYR